MGEIRRVLNTFLQLLERDDSKGLILAATNHPELLDKALFRRFDDVIEYDLPDADITRRILRTRLGGLAQAEFNWDAAVRKADKLSQAEVSRAAMEALKHALLQDRTQVTTAELMQSLEERTASHRP